MNFKLIDFGHSEFQNIDRLKGPRGTRFYMAPEIIENKIYNGHQIDVFSLGVTMFCLDKGLFPWGEATVNDPFYNLNLRHPTKFWNCFSKKSSCLFKDLFSKMVDPNPKKRIELS